jgi:hypothetical protein
MRIVFPTFIHEWRFASRIKKCPQRTISPCLAFKTDTFRSFGLFKHDHTIDLNTLYDTVVNLSIEDSIFRQDTRSQRQNLCLCKLRQQSGNPTYTAFHRARALGGKHSGVPMRLSHAWPKNEIAVLRSGECLTVDNLSIEDSIFLQDTRSQRQNLCLCELRQQRGNPTYTTFHRARALGGKHSGVPMRLSHA